MSCRNNNVESERVRCNCNCVFECLLELLEDAIENDECREICRRCERCRRR